jgi:hypothetical protein
VLEAVGRRSRYARSAHLKRRELRTKTGKLERILTQLSGSQIGPVKSTVIEIFDIDFSFSSRAALKPATEIIGFSSHLLMIIKAKHFMGRNEDSTEHR